MLWVLYPAVFDWSRVISEWIRHSMSVRIPYNCIILTHMKLETKIFSKVVHTESP